jgi:hypothetical protein
MNLHIFSYKVSDLMLTNSQTVTLGSSRATLRDLARPKAIVTGACLVPAKHMLVSLLLNQRVVLRLRFPTGLNRNMQHPVFQRIGERFRPKATLSR